jgi:hypothetical protein
LLQLRSPAVVVEDPKIDHREYLESAMGREARVRLAAKS